MQTAETILFGVGASKPVQARVAKSIGKSRSTVSRWAKDAGKIPLDDLKRLVRCMGLSDRQILQIFGR